jgi:hypothetical protein
MWSEVTDTLLDDARRNPRVRELVSEVESAVVDGRLSPTAAAQRLLRAVRSE